MQFCSNPQCGDGISWLVPVISSPSLLSPLSSINKTKQKKKRCFWNYLEKNIIQSSMGLLSKDNTDNHDCFGEARLSADGGLQGNIDGEDNHR